MLRDGRVFLTIWGAQGRIWRCQRTFECTRRTSAVFRRSSPGADGQMEGQFLPRDGGGWPQGVNRIIIATNFFKFSRFKKGKRGKPGQGGGGGGVCPPALMHGISTNIFMFFHYNARVCRGQGRGWPPGVTGAQGGRVKQVLQQQKGVRGGGMKE